MVSQYLDIIESICYKLNNRITPTDILKWLKNFKEEDWNKALTVLNQIEYYSSEDCIREFDINLSKIISHFEQDRKYETISKILHFLGLSKTRLFNIRGLDKKIVLHPIGEFIKSATSMFYLIKQTPTFKEYSNYITVVEDPNDLFRKLDKDSYLVLVDDIIGSGGSLDTYFNEKIAPILNTKKLLTVKKIVLSIVWLEKSLKIIQKIDATIYGNFRRSAFVQEGSVFGYRPKVLAIRNFCYEYGSGLYTTTDRETGKITNHALGHDNSQALIVFAHSTPNNTLPIMWSSKKGWKPIFPRFGQDKIETSYNLKYDSQKWISILRKHGFENLFEESDNKYMKINLQQLMILKLKKIGKNDNDICQLLGLNNSDYELIINIGIHNNIFNKDKSITDYGNSIYDEIKKKEILAKKNNIDLKTNSLYSENIYYLPSSFRGFK